MPSKYQIIKEMAAQEALSITYNTERFMAFLHTAANNYKYSFQEQLLIHAQKPDATACAEIEVWTKLGKKRHSASPQTHSMTRSSSS